MLDLEKVGQSHGVQLSQWCHSMANIHVYKNCLMHYFAPALAVSDIY